MKKSKFTAALESVAAAFTSQLRVMRGEWTTRCGLIETRNAELFAADEALRAAITQLQDKYSNSVRGSKDIEEIRTQLLNQDNHFSDRIARAEKNIADIADIADILTRVLRVDPDILNRVDTSCGTLYGIPPAKTPSMIRMNGVFYISHAALIKMGFGSKKLSEFIVTEPAHEVNTTAEETQKRSDSTGPGGAQ